MRPLVFLLLLCLSAGRAEAQRVSRSYQDVSLSEALKDLNAATKRYEVSFIYDELEDFRVTTSFNRLTLPDAVRQVVGFYPMRVTEADSLIAVECTHKTDRHLKGRLVDEADAPIAYANISLLSPADSSLVGGGVSNEHGDFVIPVDIPRVIAKYSYVGYKTVVRTCDVGDVGVVQMQPAEYTIKGVTVKGTRIMNYVDKSVHTFSDLQIKQASNVRDLLQHVEDLEIDPITNKIRRLDGGDVKMLLNGASCSDIELKAIPANKILRVEYYNIPPARYADAGALINIITRNLETGVDAYVGANTAFNTGFTDDEAYVYLTSGNHQLALAYTFSLRDYTKRFGTTTYDYLLNNEQTHYESNTHDKFGYTWNDPVVKYAYNKPDNIAVQVEASPHFDSYHSDGTEDIQILSASSHIAGKGSYGTHNKSFGPNVNVYVQKMLPKNQTLDIDLVGTYYHNSGHTNEEETNLADGGSLLSDIVNQKNNKLSFIGELAYTKRWTKGNLSLGYRGTFGRSEATISNVLSGYQDYSYASASYQNYMYAEYSGAVGRLMYRIGAGATQVTQRNDDTSDSRWLFTPKLILSTNLSPKMNLQWVTSSSTTTPGISQLSNNASLVIPGVMSVGNPYLKSYNSYQSQFIYKWNLGWLNSQFSLVCVYRDAPVGRYYTEQMVNGTRYLVGRSENAYFSSDVGGSYLVKLDPWQNGLLTLTLQGYVLRQTISSPIIGRYHHTWAPLNFTVNFRKGDWGASYQGGVVSKRLSGSTLDAGENSSHLKVYWQNKGWNIYVSNYWAFTRSRYSGYTLPKNILQRHYKTWIDDNRSMFVVGFGYNFSSGKSFNINRKLRNKDSDKGSF